MPATDEKLANQFGEHISHGSLFLSSVEQIDEHPDLLPYAHYLQQAWAELNLAGTLCVDRRPTVYLCEGKRFTTAQKRERQRFVWNQGLVPLLVLLTPGQVEVYSGVCKPLKPGAPDNTPDTTLISDLGNIAEALECAKFVRSIETGQFFQERRDFFPPEQAIDRCLVRNLIQAAMKLKSAGWKLDRAHALLGRALFVSFLQQRGFIKPHHFPASTESLLHIVKGRTVEEAKHLLYGEGGLFPALKREFNGTMFDDALTVEARDIRKPHLDILADFLGGAEMDSGQLTIFSDYDFHVIPVETISAIYEEFMKEEDLDRKLEEGAFYTPRHLAETTLHIAVENRYTEAANWRALDPACGSGIFLVGMFNMLAAQWLRDNANRTKKTKAQALLEILQQRIRGVDLNLDACRIASFSLYLALFEKLQPIDLDEFKEKVRADSFLPPLLWSDKEGLKAAPAVIIHGDFLHDKLPLEKDYNLVIGNPPWESRGKEQIALHFAQRVPEFICADGIGCLILPTTILVNRHGTLDGKWFRSVTAEKIVQLADYRKLMFASAIHAGFIVRFQKAKPTLDHVIVYETPKVSRFDRRRGVIVVEPDDQKTLSQRAVLEASLREKSQARCWLQALWGRKFWGSPRDEAFLRRLDFLPRLTEVVGESKEKKRWTGGVGFQPFFPGHYAGLTAPLGDWKLTDAYLANSAEFPHLVVFANSLQTLGDGLRATRHRKSEVPASLSKLRRKPPSAYFTPPMVIYSKGFTKFAFCPFKIRFQDGLRSICGEADDADLLRFLAAALASELFAYTTFHAGSNLGIGRDQLHVYESLNLPFPLPEDELAPATAAKIVTEAAAMIKSVEKDGAKATPAKRTELVRKAKEQLEPLIETYFSVSENERILITDTLSLWQPSIHKQNLDLDIPALRFPGDRDRKSYADTLANELNRFSRKQQIRISVEGMASEELNLIFVTVIFGNDKRPYRETGGDAELWKALARINKAAQKENGPISYLRGFTYFERDRMHILKPATMRNWSRTSALNDADAAVEYLRGKPA
jgi:N-6 DNA Methylase